MLTIIAKLSILDVRENPEYAFYIPLVTKSSGLHSYIVKVGLSPLKNIFFICFNESPLKMMKNVFNFTLKALFVLKIFKFLS